MRSPAPYPTLLLALLLTLATPRPARAADTKAFLDLWVNHVDKGEVMVALRAADVLVAREDLAKAGLVGVEGRSETALGGHAVSLASLAPALSYEMDEAALSLKIEVPVRMLQTSVVDLGPVVPRGIEHLRDTSAFLNYGVRASYPLAVTTLFEGGLSVSGNLLSSTLTVSAPGGLVRGLSSFTVDDRADLRRWVAGETFVSGGALGAGLFVAGLTVSRTFSLDPYFIQTPSLGTSGSTPTPALLDVYVNGVLVRSVPIAPGPFQVQNVPVPAGSGDVRYVVRDLLGQQTAVTSPYYATPSALAKGLSDYTYSVGARRWNPGTESFDFGAAGFLGHHRYGFSDRVTAGVRLEGAVGLVSGGPSLTLTLPFGQIDAEAAASVTTQGTGYAGLLAYSFTSRRYGFGLLVRGATDGYATLSLAPTDDREQLRVNGWTSVSIHRRASLGAQYTLVLDRDLGPSGRVGTSATVQILRGLSLNLGVGRSKLQQGTTAIDALAALSLSIGSMINVSVGGELGAGSNQAYVDVNRPLPAGNGFGFRGYAAAGETPTALATGQYQGPYGRVTATLQGTPAGPTGSVEAAGALVWVEGTGVLFTRPVQDGFAVLRVPGAEGVRGFLNNQEIGRTDSNGSLVLPTLLPYYGNRISIADSDIALDRAVSVVERTVAPAYRGGALVLFESRPARFYRGRVVVVLGGSEVVPSYGEISVVGPAGEVTSPLGKKGELELEGLPPGRFPARVVHARGTCAFDLQLPSSAGVVVALGELRCTEER